MDEKNKTGVVPQNHSGKSIDASSSKDFSDIDTAKKHYEIAKSRLLDINHWDELDSGVMATFTIADADGGLLNQQAQQGLLIRINIPGPGSADGDGYDWVHIEEIHEVNNEDSDSIAIRVRPVSAPDQPGDRVAHFYSDQSTSTFVVNRESKTVTAAVYDRNIEVNDQSDSLVGQLRNAITGLTAKGIFSKIQWQALSDGLIS
jgi:hypothetical protein